MPNITHLSVKKDVPPTGYWDHAFLDDMLKGLGKSDRHVFVIPGKNQCSSESIWKINAELAKHKKILVFITSDEEGKGFGRPSCCWSESGNDVCIRIHCS